MGYGPRTNLITHRLRAGSYSRPIFFAMPPFPITQRPVLRLRPVRLPSKLRPLHETTFPVRPRLETVSTPLFRGARGRQAGGTPV
jgi:hypothetical protein